MVLTATFSPDCLCTMLAVWNPPAPWSNLMMQLRDELEYLQPFAPDELPELAGGWEQKELTAGGHKFRIIRPAAPDALLDTPETLAAHESYGYMPYWGYLWPAAFDLCAALAAADLPKGIRTLEIGAGIGLAGLGALAEGLDVVFSDYDRTSVRLALTNAVLNGFPDAQGVYLDWHHPPDCQFPLILGCEVIYEQANHGPILDVLDRMLAPDGECWLADPRRHTADKFVALAKDRGYDLTCQSRPHRPYDTSATMTIDMTTDIWILRKNK